MPPTATARLFAAPAPVRAAFRILDLLAPSVSARWAEHIWMTLPPRRPERPDPAGPGEPFTVPLGSGTIVGESWGDGPPIYLMHGWAGYGNQLAGFVPPLVARGHRVVSFDAPSHGRSGPGRDGPRSSSIPEFAAALAAVADRYGPAHAVIAHSLGAAATATALCDGLTAARTVLIAPMAGPGAHADDLAAVLGYGDRTRRRLIARVERRVGAPMHHFDVPALGRAVRMPPTLVVHDRGDRSTRYEDGVAIAAAWSADLHTTTGLGHNRVLRDPSVIDRVTDFLTTTAVSWGRTAPQISATAAA